jgi:hypothetical protein
VISSIVRRAIAVVIGSMALTKRRIMGSLSTISMTTGK